MNESIKAASKDKNMILLFWVLVIPTIGALILGLATGDFLFASVLAGCIEILAIIGIMWWKL